MRIAGCLIVALLAGGAAVGAADPKDLFVTSPRCMACHNGLSSPRGEDISIGSSWRGSMMAHSARDPYWQAAVRREVLEHPTHRDAVEDKCSSCHMPMARFAAKTDGRAGLVFAHLPVASARTEESALAADGVSCTLCHQIKKELLGTKESFTAGFVVDVDRPPGERAVYGPFDVDRGRARVMRSAAAVEPVRAAHLRDAAFCASCHTLYTYALGPQGEVVGEFPEQVPYLEWRHSAYEGARSCQSCHMAELEEAAPIASVLGLPRDGFSRHLFRGGNFFLPRVFLRHRIELGVRALPQDLARVESETLLHLQTGAARVAVRGAGIASGRLDFEVAVENLAGHKLPTAYPSRRAWLMVSVRDRAGRVVFSSGSLNEDGSIAGNDNDADATRHEPHHDRLVDPEQVQIYEAILADHRGDVTTGLLSAVRYLKDNRLLPEGFDKATAGGDIAVYGGATDDPDFQAGGDLVRYSVAVDAAEGPFGIRAALWYQPIGFRWARNLDAYDSAETKRFGEHYRALAPGSGTRLAEDETIVAR